MKKVDGNSPSLLNNKIPGLYNNKWFILNVKFIIFHHILILPDLHCWDMVEDSLVKIVTSEKVNWDIMSHYQSRRSLME